MIEKAHYRISKTYVCHIVKITCILTGMWLILLLSSGSIHAYLYAETSPCNNLKGTVLDVVNDEVFTIAICDDVKVFEEFSYCYEVEKGDIVFFEWNPGDCEVVSFTVLGSGVQCGVICP